MRSLTKWLLFALGVVVVAVAGLYGAMCVIAREMVQEFANDAAVHTAEYIREFDRFPTEMSDLRIGSADDIYDLYVDPRSDKYGASVWYRPRGSSDNAWIEGHTPEWNLESRPPPKER
jgi:hypothetical protein